MPIEPLNAALDMLGRDSRLRHNASDTVSFLMDLLYYGEFDIFEQVSSGEIFERVNLIGTKGQHRLDEPLWLIGTFNSSFDPFPNAWPSLRGDAFAPRVDRARGLLHGLGANAKLDIILKILAASRFRLEELGRPICIAAISGEEALGSGARSLLSSGPAPCGVALVGAPTNLELWTDHPGCITLKLELMRRLRHRRMPPCRGFHEVEITGRSAHAQSHALGDDAIERGLAVLEDLRAAGDIRLLSFEAGEAANRVAGRCHIRVATSYDDIPDLGPDAVTRPIEDGTALPFPIGGLFAAWLKARDAGVEAIVSRLGIPRNPPAARPLVPAWTGRVATDRNAVSGQVTVWTGPGVSTHDLCERFATAVQQALAGIEEIEVEITVLQDRPPLAARDDAGPLLEVARGALRDAGLVPVVSGGTLTSDAGLLRGAGIDTLVFGPGRGPSALYRDDESIPVAHIEAAFNFYVNVIRRWCVQPT